MSAGYKSDARALADKRPRSSTCLARNADAFDAIRCYQEQIFNLTISTITCFKIEVMERTDVEEPDLTDISALVEQVHELADLELAILLCLVAKEHCIIEFEKGTERLLEQEIELVRGLASVQSMAFAERHDRSPPKCLASPIQSSIAMQTLLWKTSQVDYFCMKAPMEFRILQDSRQ